MVDKEYPVYSISILWTMGKPTYWKDSEGKKIESKTNSTGFTWAFRRKFSEETIKNKVLKWWLNYRKKKLEKEEPISDLKIEVKFLGMQSWWQQWFSHETFNSFETDQDAFDSFFRWFTDNGFRHSYNEHPGYGSEDLMLQTDKYGNKHCLMGAEEYWRWKVCHCKHCEKRKHRRTIITH